MLSGRGIERGSEKIKVGDRQIQRQRLITETTSTVWCETTKSHNVQFTSICFRAIVDSTAYRTDYDIFKVNCVMVGCSDDRVIWEV